MVILKAEVSFIEVNFSLNCFTTCSVLRTHSVLAGSQNNYYAKMAQVGIIYSGHLQWAYIHLKLSHTNPATTHGQPCGYMATSN